MLRTRPPALRLYCDLVAYFGTERDEPRATCEPIKNHAHGKTRALAVELLDDGDAIFQSPWQ